MKRAAIIDPEVTTCYLDTGLQLVDNQSRHRRLRISGITLSSHHVSFQHRWHSRGTHRRLVWREQYRANCQYGLAAWCTNDLPRPGRSMASYSHRIIENLEHPGAIQRWCVELLSLLLADYRVVQLEKEGNWSEFWEEGHMARDIPRMKVFMPEQAETIENAGMEDSTEALTGGHNMAELYLRTQLYPPSCDSLVGVGQKAWNEAAYSQTSVRGEVGLDALV
jgi:hypothetical protein